MVLLLGKLVLVRLVGPIDGDIRCCRSCPFRGRNLRAKGYGENEPEDIVACPANTVR